MSDLSFSPLPPMARVRQTLDGTAVGSIVDAVAKGLAPHGSALAGRRICILAGSRGIDRYVEVLAAVVDIVRAAGGDPFVTPAMGSHGGATATGQRAVLERLGVTEARLGCPLLAGMDVVAIGEVSSAAGRVPVFVDAAAFAADAVIPVNRIKAHTGFRGPVESGLSKMLAIGLGNREGAHGFHSVGYEAFSSLIPAVAAHTCAKLTIPFGVALLENGYGRLARIEVVSGAALGVREPELLVEARGRMARLPFDSLDILVVDRIGKDVSGVGMDPNVIGRDHRGNRLDPPHIQRIFVRGLTEATAGHATGIGVADVTLKSLVDAIDWDKTRVNSLIARTPENARVPLTVRTDREALAIALMCCTGLDGRAPRIARIRDTHHLAELWVGEPLLDELSDCLVIEPPRSVDFDADGDLN